MLRSIIAGVMAWLAISAPPAHADEAEDKAVAFVEKLGGTVNRDEKAPGKPVITIDLSTGKITDVGLKELARLKTLTTLKLDDTDVTDLGLKELATLKNLTTLTLSQTKVTGTGLKELAPLKNLNTLELDGAQVTDMGLLHALSRAHTVNDQRPTKPEDVTALDLSYTDVTDTGLKELAPFKNLNTLDLHFTKVTEAGVKELQKSLPACKISK